MTKEFRDEDIAIVLICDRRSLSGALDSLGTNCGGQASATQTAFIDFENLPLPHGDVGMALAGTLRESVPSNPLDSFELMIGYTDGPFPIASILPILGQIGSHQLKSLQLEQLCLIVDDDEEEDLLLVDPLLVLMRAPQSQNRLEFAIIADLDM
jgi:hypothetical protein